MRCICSRRSRSSSSSPGNSGPRLPPWNGRATRRVNVAAATRLPLCGRSSIDGSGTRASPRVVVFALIYQLPINFSGFVAHVRSITAAADAYRVFEPTAAGRMAFLRVTIRLIGESMAWPPFLVSVAGIAVGLRRVRLRMVSGWLLIILLSYYDSRYAVARWMAAHFGEGEIGMTGLPEYLPRLDGYRIVELTTIEELRRDRPRYFVMNADYARAVPGDTPWGRLVRGLETGTLGYVARFRYRTPAPWPWLPEGHPQLVGPRRDTVVFSILRNINPERVALERRPALESDDRTP
jgi:hypothetical protein